MSSMQDLIDAEFKRTVFDPTAKLIDEIVWGPSSTLAEMLQPTREDLRKMEIIDKAAERLR